MGELALQQGAHLHRAGLGAHQLVIARRLHEQGVRHEPGRMVGREVEGVEVEPFGLQLGALGDLPPHGDEDIAHVVDERRQRMAGTDRVLAHRQGHVDPLGLELGGELTVSDLLGPLLQCLVDTAACLTDQGAGGLALVLRH